MSHPFIPSLTGKKSQKRQAQIFNLLASNNILLVKAMKPTIKKFCAHIIFGRVFALSKMRARF
jgi:hypothetical protein